MFPKESSTIKSLNPGVPVKKGIKVKISSKNIKVSRLSTGVCRFSFHNRIAEKYEFFERSGGLFPNLIFFKLTFSDSAITNMKILKVSDRHFSSSFDFTFYLLRGENARLYRKISLSNNILPCSGEKAKPTFYTLCQKLAKRDSTSRLLNARSESTIFYSNCRHLIAKVPGASPFQKSCKSCNSPLEGKLSFEQLLLNTEGIFLKSGVLCRKNQQNNIDSTDSKILSKKFGISSDKTQNLDNKSFFKIAELSEQGPDFLIWKLHPKQKHDMHMLILNKGSKVEKGISYDTFCPLRNLNLQYAISYEDAAIPQVEMRDKRKVIYEGGQDIILRKSVTSSSKELSRDIEENLPGYTSKGNISFLKEENNSYSVSSGDINTIANKVYRLLETKLLIEKERRGLR
ncbi:MAG: hypothetical protein ACPK85_04505 [Methanosarcina sp.]